MNRKGFTLVELLAVIVILAIILAIAIPGISNMIDNARESAYQNSEKLMVDAAKIYFTLNQNLLPTNIGETTIAQLSDLRSNNLISEIKNLTDQSISCDGYVMIRKDDASTYKYEPYLKCGNDYASKTIITDGLVLDMPLGNYKSGNTFLDRSGNGNNGTDYVTALSANRFNEESRATSFLGANDYIDVPNSSSLNITKAITVSSWIKMNTLEGSYKNLVVKGDSGFQYYWFFIDSGNRINASIMNGGTKYTNVTGTIVSLNEWINVSFTYDGKSIKVYKNGVMIGTPYPCVGAIDANTVNLRIATPQVWWSTTLAWNFDGEIDDVKIYNRALSSDEVKHNFNIENFKSI